MAVTVKPLKPTKSELKKYVKFGINLYKGNPYHVPPLIFDEINTLSPSKNPAFEFCEAQSFLAEKDGRIAGRITAIINKAANDKFGNRAMRFGFVDFIDDDEVVDALFKAAEDWGREKGMDTIIGPLGFSDMDHEGMLTDGFDRPGTLATIYNYPYYPRHMERMGYGKEADWVEYRIKIPNGIPEKMNRIAEIVRRKYNLKNLHFKSRKVLKQKYGRAVFDLLNEAYKDLYGFVKLTDKQIDYYIDLYLGILRLDDIAVVVDGDDKLVAFGISMPSLSDALRKTHGKLFPFGWYHFLKALKGKVDVVDLYLVAVAPEYQNKGVNSLLFTDLIPAYIKNGYKYAESNLELEGNESVQKQWEYFERELHRRRRAWSKSLLPAGE